MHFFFYIMVSFHNKIAFISISVECVTFIPLVFIADILHIYFKDINASLPFNQQVVLIDLFQKTSQYLCLNVVAVQAKMRRILISFMKSFKTISSVCYLQFANCVWFHYFLCFLVLTRDCMFVCFLK